MITSFANERIKNLRKLHDRKAREESGLFFIEGLRVVAEAVEQEAGLAELVVAPDLLKSAFGKELVESQRARGVEVLEVSDDVFHAPVNKRRSAGAGGCRAPALEKIRGD